MDQESRIVTVLRELTPPLAWKGVKLCSQAAGLYHPPVPEERDAAWYDGEFRSEGGQHYHKPYRKSAYYFLWTVLVDRVIRSGAQSVLDIGCGPGQMASFLRDRGLRKYVGLDLSPVAISLAKEACPEFEFVTASAFDTDLFTTVKYDTVICTEFLEHVNDEIRVIERIAGGTRFFGTVPNFPWVAHVRTFANCDEVSKRYGSLFNSFSVDAFESPVDGMTFFLMEGTRK
jgi:SAM-dependent methyltransferase